jgi:hypothetical protein
MAGSLYLADDTMERMWRAVEKVEQRLYRTVNALEAHGVPYAVIGGNAVAAWVAQVDEGAVRNTRDVDILIRRADLPACKAAMATIGFWHDVITGVDVFIDGPDGVPSQGVHLLFAGEKVKPTDPVPVAEFDETERGKRFQVISLPALVRMKLVANRRKDQVHIQDMIRIGLIDTTWLTKYPPELAERLMPLLADPNG